ncbi:MAG: Asp/Glu/hydantoin racemase [Verrucomicrobia bacterium]|jgi:Asp/Glu/hydantoin racemase|nr:Asp/Glu/hydantoin racemase [Verrucomicrobiota bacterium]
MQLAFLHTSATLVPVFKELADEHFAGKEVDIFNLADDSLIQNTIRRGKLTPDTARRVIAHIRSLEEAGAERILVTCSSIGPAVEMAAMLVEVPVHRVDRPMAEKAVAEAARIGVAATLPTTLEPTTDLIRRVAAETGKDITLATECCEGAFDALMSGDAATHDTRVKEALRRLAQESDIIVLAQASMARVAEQLADSPVPILASPALAMRFLAGQI